MNFLINIFIVTIAVLISSYLLPGVTVKNFLSALLVAFVLALLNTFLKPLMVILTIPFTIVTFGLFLLVINALIIMLVSAIIPSFKVDGFWWAMLFSIILSIVTWLLDGLVMKA
jgi:putative membrane protein